jgi:hypothetical protein
VVADSIPEVAEDHFHLRLSSPNLVFQLHASLVGGVLTTDAAYPDMFALEWYEWNPEQFELVVSTDSFRFIGFGGLTHVLLWAFMTLAVLVSSVRHTIHQQAYDYCT